jgi:hypothetical protein
MNKTICKCGCGNTVKYSGASFCHGHHLRLKEFQRKPNAPIINVCQECKIQFIAKKSHTIVQKFCSRECSQRGHKTGIIRTCTNCKGPFYIAKNRIKVDPTRGKFCGKKCQLEKWNRDALKTQAKGSYRQNAWKTYDKKCYDCNMQDARVLVIHHIDGNRNNGKIENLIPVCHNCHCVRHIVLSGNHRLPSYRGKD